MRWVVRLLIPAAWLLSVLWWVADIPQAFAFNAVCDLWALFGAGTLATSYFNAFRQSGAKRVVWGSIGLAFMLGRLLSGSAVSYVFMALPPALRPSPFWVFGVLPPVVLLLAGIVAIAVIGLIAGTVAGFVIGAPVAIFNQIVQFENAMVRFRYQRGGLTSYLVRFSYWLAGKEPPYVPDDSKGARFAVDDEIAKLKSKNPAAMAFGHHRKEPLLLFTDKHVFVQASTRSGKGVALIIPHLLRYPGSCFVLDPKGENARAAGRQRAQLNDLSLYLDPFGITGLPQARFNPLARLTAANMEAGSKQIAAAMILGQRDHWIGGAQQLFAALILFVVTNPDIPPAYKDLPAVRRLLLGGIKLALNDMAQSEAADGLVASLAQSFLATPERELGSIISTAQRETEILDNPFIIACLSASGPGEEVDFAAWHSRTMSVFLCLSAPKFPTFNRWLRLVLTAALDEMTDQLRPPALPVCFMLDELATLGHLAPVENAIGLAAGYGVQLVTIWQDWAQLRDLYQGRAASFIGNAGIRAVFNLDDYETADYWSKFLGSRSVDTYSAQTDIYGLTEGGTSGQAMRPLYAPEELMRDLAAGVMLVLVQGARPFMTARVPYFADQALAGRWDDPRQPLETGLAPPEPEPPDDPAPIASDTAPADHHEAAAGIAPASSPGAAAVETGPEWISDEEAEALLREMDELRQHALQIERQSQATEAGQPMPDDQPVYTQEDYLRLKARADVVWARRAQWRGQKDAGLLTTTAADSPPAEAAPPAAASRFPGPSSLSERARRLREQMDRAGKDARTPDEDR